MMKKNEFEDGVKLLSAILTGDKSYIEAFLEANPKSVSPDSFHKYELEGKEDTAHIDFFGLYHYNLFEVATAYGYPKLVERFTSPKKEVSYEVKRLIDRLKEICSHIIAENMDVINRWDTYERDFVIPSGFAATQFPDQARVTGDATLLDLALIWGKPKAAASMANKDFYLSLTTIASIRNATAEQVEWLKGKNYFTGEMEFEDNNYGQSTYRGPKPKKIKKIETFDLTKITRSALSFCRVKMVMALSQFNPSLITAMPEFGDPLIDVFSDFIDLNNAHQKELVDVLLSPTVTLANDTAQRLLSAIERRNRRVTKEKSDRAKWVFDKITGSNSAQVVNGEVIVSGLTGDWADITGHLLLLLRDVDVTATYVYPKRNIRATLLEMVERHAPHYLTPLKNKVMASQRSPDSNGDQHSSASENYELIPASDITLAKKLAEGGFAAVYQGEWDGASVAIKVIDTTKSDTSTFQSLMVETKLLSHLRHPNIIQFFGVSKSPDKYYFMMELMPAGDLYAVLRTGQVSFSTKLLFTRQILSALVYLHKRNIIHRDIKLENVLVDGERKNVKLSDFGLAVGQKLGDPAYVPEITPGTIPYMAPEVLLEKDAYFTQKSDMYAFAILLWEMMTLAIAWHNMNVEDILCALEDNKRPELKADIIPQNVAHLIKFCWQGGDPPEPKASLDQRFSASEALAYFDGQFKNL